MSSTLIKRALLIQGHDDVMKHRTVFNADLDDLKAYLKTPIGGGWKDSEIFHLHSSSEKNLRPTYENIEKHILALEFVDYALVVYSGHGSTSYPTKDVKNFLENDKEFYCKDLYSDKRRQAVILDCCRKIEAPPKAIITNESFSQKIASARVLDLELHREYYNNQLIKLPDGYSETAYSCSYDQYSYFDSNTGSYFIQELLKTPKSWLKVIDAAREKSSGNSYPLVQAVYDASPMVKELALKEKMKQDPHMVAPKCKEKVPFAVYVPTDRSL